MRLTSLFFLFLLLTTSCGDQRQEQQSSDSSAQSTQSELSKAAVSSSHPLAIEAGLSVLENGGNAFDAAVTIATTLGVVEPQHSGLGGYGSMLIFDASTGKARFLSFSGKYPADLDKSVLKPSDPNAVENSNGPKATTTPNLLSGLVALHSEYGSTAWPELLSPAISYAKEGVEVDGRLANDIEKSFEQFSDYTKSIYGRDGAGLKAGDRLLQADLGRSLEVIAQQGAAVWGEGDIAQAVAEGINQAGGYLSLVELSAMEANWYDPISITYNGHEVVTSGAPTAGFSALHRVGEMGLYNLPSIGLNTSAYIHLFAEVSKHAYWTYLRYGGSIDTILPNTGMVLSKDYWQWMAQNIRPDSASVFHPPFDFEYISDASNTTHFVVADAAGNMVSATLSLGDVFGSKFMPAGTGFWMNNGAKFANFEQDNTPRDANPGRERVVMDSPIMLFKNGRPLAGIGTPGGGLMPQVMAQVVLNMTDFRQPLSVALSQPSVVFDPSGIVYHEPGLPEAVIENLNYMGHHLEEKSNLGKPNGIEVVYDQNGNLQGYISQSTN